MFEIFEIYNDGRFYDAHVEVEFELKNDSIGSFDYHGYWYKDERPDYYSMESYKVLKVDEWLPSIEKNVTLTDWSFLAGIIDKHINENYDELLIRYEKTL